MTTVSETYRILPDEPVPDIETYMSTGGGEGLVRAHDLGPDDTIAEIKAAHLRGRGGAGFPTAIKWKSVGGFAKEVDCPAYVCCNAAEGEPGTYKDRPLMAANPYRVVEGVLIAMFVVDAKEGFIALKQRFTHEVERMISARDEARRAGWPGADKLHIVPGPDDYLFGEESAMLEVVEGKLAMPRLLPPYQSGLFASMDEPNPTVVNNAETLSHAARILAEGPEPFRAAGTEDSPGTMIFTVVGDVERPGVYELPMGIPLGELVIDIAGAENPKAMVSGTSNPIATPAHLDVPCSFGGMQDAGLGLGSGGFAVYGEHRDMVQVTAVLAKFLAAESCGQCLACKLGTGDIYERLDRLAAGKGTREDVDEVGERTYTVHEGNRCFLPVGAALTVRSMLENFSDEFERAAQGVACPPELVVPVPKIESIDPDTGEVVYGQPADAPTTA